MPDSCVADDDSVNDASLAIALNVAGVVLGLVAVPLRALFGGRTPAETLPQRWRNIILDVATHANSLAFAAILLGGTTVALFYATGSARSEVGCVIALSNTAGPVPISLLAAVSAVAVVAADLFFGAAAFDQARTRSCLQACMSLDAAVALFPRGAGWRARDVAVTPTAALVAVFSACVLAFYDDYLRVPTDASWDVTIGALLVSSVCCGPVLVCMAAVELTAVVAACETQHGLASCGKLLGRTGPPSTAAAEQLALVDAEAGSIEGAASSLLVKTGTQAPSESGWPLAVLRHWALRTLPSLTANLVVYQLFLWLPVYGAEVISERLGLGYSDASAVAWSSVAVLAAVLVWAWARWKRSSEGENEEPVHVRLVSPL